MVVEKINNEIVVRISNSQAIPHEALDSKLFEIFKNLSSLEKTMLVTNLIQELVKEETLKQKITKYRGLHAHIWNIDGQEYTNQLRSDDRI